MFLWPLAFLEPELARKELPPVPSVCRICGFWLMAEVLSD